MGEGQRLARGLATTWESATNVKRCKLLPSALHGEEEPGPGRCIEVKMGPLGNQGLTYSPGEVLHAGK